MVTQEDAVQAPADQATASDEGYNTIIAKADEAIMLLDNMQVARAAALLGELKLITETLRDSA
jgi:hypothetical protein